MVFTFYDHELLTEGDYTFPEWSDGLGWFIFSTCMVWIPLFAVVKVVRQCLLRENAVRLLS